MLPLTWHSFLRFFSSILPLHPIFCLIKAASLSSNPPCFLSYLAQKFWNYISTPILLLICPLTVRVGSAQPCMFDSGAEVLRASRKEIAGLDYAVRVWQGPSRSFHMVLCLPHRTYANSITPDHCDPCSRGSSLLIHESIWHVHSPTNKPTLVCFPFIPGKRHHTS